jgi:hypothetical protein
LHYLTDKLPGPNYEPIKTRISCINEFNNISTTNNIKISKESIQKRSVDDKENSVNDKDKSQIMSGPRIRLPGIQY